MDKRNAASERTRTEFEFKQCCSDAKALIYDARGNGGGRNVSDNYGRSPEQNNGLHRDCVAYSTKSYGQYAVGLGTLRANGGDIGGAVRC